MSKPARLLAILVAILLVVGIDFLSTRPWSQAAPEKPTAAIPLVEASEEDDDALIPNSGPLTLASVTPAPSATVTRPAPVEPTLTQPPAQTSAPSATPLPKAAPLGAGSPSPTQAPTNLLPAERWREWPVMPGAVSQALRDSYMANVAQGKIDPHAFSILGDCQGESEGYLGVFDTSPGLVETMAADLRGFVRQFAGSFNRYNPAAKSGSSASSLLYAPWNDNKEGKCTAGETPLDCELRVHRPSIVFIQLGTHFETPERNYAYLTTIVKKVLDTGAVPILVTKADNLEGTNFVNGNIARLAVEYNLPLWNFWSSVQGLPAGGLKPDGMLLTQEGNTVHQLSALRVLGAVWQGLQ